MLLAVGFARLACADDTNIPPDTIANHRQKYIALMEDYDAHYSTIITNEPRRYAHVQAELRERDALVRLGYLVETNIAFDAGWSKDLVRELQQAALIDGKVASFTTPHDTNGLRVICVWARPEDVQTWQKIIKEHKKK